MDQTKTLLIKDGYIPLDKSWIIRMGILDLLRDQKQDSINFLTQLPALNDDLKSLLKALQAWDKGTIPVGESGTLYRFLQFISWKFGLHKKFIKSGTLKSRVVTQNSDIVNLPLKGLLKLDNQTSQWASAAVLCGNREKIITPPFKLDLTYKAVKHWNSQRKRGKMWLPKYDETILNQACAFLGLLKGKKVKFTPKQAEDYCFARALGFITREKGGKLWPSLYGHESNRIEEMETALKQAEEGKFITSKDHRVIQTAAMYQKLHNLPLKAKYPDSVSKSWPQFWNFLGNSNKLA